MAFHPTNEQKKAIETQGNVLVAAAAGSGKTAVLVERVIQKLIDKVNPISADRLLIVTFTNAAASEMRTRIEKRLDDECRNNPGDVGLLRQRYLLSSAKISTIDSFCIELVRENFEKVGVNPDFKMSDGYSLSQIDERVMRDIINERLENKNDDFNALLDILGDDYGDEKFIQNILELYHYSRQLPFPNQWFDKLSDIYSDDNETVKQFAFREANTIIDNDIRSLAVICDMITVVPKAVDKFMPSFVECSECLSVLKSELSFYDWDRAYQAVSNLSFPKLPDIRGFSDYPEIVAAKNYLADYIIKKDKLKLMKLFFTDNNGLAGASKELSGPIKLLSEILKEFDEKIFKEYCELNTFTFHNTEHLALSLLCKESEDGITIRSDAEEFLNRFDEVMVDEYQDVNDLQDMLFYVLSNKETKLFVVGDVKQSIYGFRGSNPKNFLRKKNRYVPINYAKKEEPKKIILGNNFRSRAEVCDYINFFFENFMTKETGDIVYDNDEKLIPTADFPGVSDVPVEYDIIGFHSDAEGRINAEAAHIGQYIQSVINGPDCIKGKDGNLRKANYSDFAILLRSPKTRASIIVSRLKKMGIPIHYSTNGYAETIEVANFLDLIKVIDNPRSDIELLCVMLSPIFGFSNDELANIRADRKFGDLYSAVVFSAGNGNEKAKDFIKTIEQYRLLAVTLTIPKFISRLLNETGYLNMVSAMRGGTKRRNNLLLLVDYAQQFISGNGGGLGAFVDYIRLQSERGMKSAGDVSGADTVKIMSIHASKGLQFPVCIIADTASDFNSVTDSLVYSTADGIGLRYYSETDKCKINTLQREMIASTILCDGAQEELRLLYVAMTRAQDRLLFTSVFNKSDKEIADMKSFLAISGGKITADILQRTNSYAQWLLLSSLMHPDGSVLRGTASSIIPHETVSHIVIKKIEFDETDLKDMINEEKVAAAADEKLAEKIKSNFQYVYPYERIRNIEAKCSVSFLANKAESDKYAFSSKPSFMSDGGITGAERGTAMHKVMEFFNFERCDDIPSEIERLYEWQFITEREAKSVNLEALKTFFKSELFRRIQNASFVKREYRFLTEIPAIRMDPQLDEEFNDEKVIVQGAVDLCFEENGKIVIVDFKTDRTDRKEALVEAYAGQLEIYAEACSKIFHMPVEEKVIYSFALGTSIQLK